LSGIVQGWKQAHELASDVVVGGIVAIDAISFRGSFLSLGLSKLEELTFLMRKLPQRNGISFSKIFKSLRVYSF
jgi:hypothetical protein